MTRKAFLVGINRYPDPRNNLKGCVNDALLMAKTLREQYGFSGTADIKLLTDERATTANIRKGLEGLVAAAAPSPRAGPPIRKPGTIAIPAVGFTVGQGPTFLPI